MKPTINIVNKSIVCLPVFNEEEAIREMIVKIKELKLDLVITDGGSTDSSLKIAQEEGVTVLKRPGKGKGHGMIQAMNYAKEIGKDYIVFIDCDLTYPIDRIPDLINEIPQHDMVVGARRHTKMKLKSVILNQALKQLIRILFFRTILDGVSGLRIIKIDKYLPYLTKQDMDLEMELTGISLRKNLKLKEIQIDYFERVGRSKLSFAEILNNLWALINIRLKSFS